MAWSTTGDLLPMDSARLLHVERPAERTLIIRGRREIYPREWRSFVQDPKVGKGRTAFPWRNGVKRSPPSSAAPGATIEKEELIDYMRARFAPNKTPKHWCVVEAFRLDGIGQKIQKSSCAKPGPKVRWAAILVCTAKTLNGGVRGGCSP